jgi:hypothetical protein
LSKVQERLDNKVVVFKDDRNFVLVGKMGGEEKQFVVALLMI